MLPWEREQGTPPPRKRKGTLSSVVVRASESTGGDDFDTGGDRGGKVTHTGSRSRHSSENSGSSSRQQPQNPRHHHNDTDVDQSGGAQYGHRSPHQQRPENHHYSSVSNGSGGNQHDCVFPHYRRQPDQNRNDAEFDQPGGPRSLASPLPQRPSHRQYDLDSNQPPRHDHHSQVLQPDHCHYDSSFDLPGGPEHGRRLWDGKDNGRFRDTSPLHGHGNGGRRSCDVSPRYRHGWGGGRSRDVSPSYERGIGIQKFRDRSPPCWRERDDMLLRRGFDEDEPEDKPLGEGIRRIDPNLTARGRNWICKDPLCGYLNFARREYCKSCNKFRYGSVEDGPYGSPHRSYSGHLSLHGPPLRFSGPLPERGCPREVNGYQSSPHGWTRESPRNTAPLRNGRKFPKLQMQRRRPDYHEEVEYGVRGRFDRPVSREWDHMDRGHDDFIHRRKVYDQHPLSAHNHWADDSRERSWSPPRARQWQDYHQRSPRRARPSQDYRRGSYAVRGHGDRSYMRARNADMHQ